MEGNCKQCGELDDLDRRGVCGECNYTRELEREADAELRAQELREARYDEDSGFYIPDGDPS